MLNLIGCTSDLCDGLDMTEATTTKGVDFIVSTAYKKEFITVISNVFNELHSLSMMKRGT